MVTKYKITSHPEEQRYYIVNEGSFAVEGGGESVKVDSNLDEKKGELKIASLKAENCPKNETCISLVFDCKASDICKHFKGIEFTPEHYEPRKSHAYVACDKKPGG